MFNLDVLDQILKKSIKEEDIPTYIIKGISQVMVLNYIRGENTNIQQCIDFILSAKERIEFNKDGYKRGMLDAIEQSGKYLLFYSADQDCQLKLNNNQTYYEILMLLNQAGSCTIEMIKDKLKLNEDNQKILDLVNDLHMWDCVSSIYDGKNHIFSISHKGKGIVRDKFPNWINKSASILNDLLEALNSSSKSVDDIVNSICRSENEKDLIEELVRKYIEILKFNEIISEKRYYQNLFKYKIKDNDESWVKVAYHRIRSHQLLDESVIIEVVQQNNAELSKRNKRSIDWILAEDREYPYDNENKYLTRFKKNKNTEMLNCEILKL